MDDDTLNTLVTETMLELDLEPDNNEARETLTKFYNKASCNYQLANVAPFAAQRDGYDRYTGVKFDGSSTIISLPHGTPVLPGRAVEYGGLRIYIASLAKQGPESSNRRGAADSKGS